MDGRNGSEALGPGAPWLGEAEEAPRFAARATREHLNGTLVDETEVEQEEPLGEADLILHDDDDDDNVGSREH